LRFSVVEIAIELFKPTDSGPLLTCSWEQVNWPTYQRFPSRYLEAQLNLALPALDQTVQPNPHNGSAKFVEAMMDVDCAVFAMSALTSTMNRAITVASVVEQIAKHYSSSSEQASLTMLLPSGAWQRRSQSTGPTVRPINGGHWWQLPSPKYTRTFEGLGSTQKIFAKGFKISINGIANALINFDSNNPQAGSKLILRKI